jgi:hypothetical protein
MRNVFLVLLVFAICWMGGCVGVAVYADYDYKNRIAAYWDLSVKASTIQQKSEYLDKFISALESTTLADNDAIWLKTPDTNTKENLKALKSLQQRMHEIFTMDVNSFQYQQAIQQITAQEQDDAKNVLDRIEGAWYLQHHILLWSWIGFLYSCFICLVVIAFALGLGAFWKS